MDVKPRLCPTCNQQLERKADEVPSKFLKRRFCDSMCRRNRPPDLAPRSLIPAVPGWPADLCYEDEIYIEKPTPFVAKRPDHKRFSIVGGSIPTE